MEKIQFLADTNQLSRIVSEAIESTLMATSKPSPFIEPDEFCYDEDEFDEDHPFTSTRMAASCEGVYSIIGNNNGYHIKDSHRSNLLETCRLRSYAVSMPHIPSGLNIEPTEKSNDELITENACESEDLEGDKRLIEGETELQTDYSESSEKMEMTTTGVVCQNLIEEESEEEDALDLEFEYEPGISLSHMEFGRQANSFLNPFGEEDVKGQKVGEQKPFRRKMSEMCTSSSCSTSKREGYQNMMLTPSTISDRMCFSTSESQQRSISTTGCILSSMSSPMVSPTRCTYCGVDYESDLQLAAELGKTLLERNKELENSLKEQQAIIDDQAQEIEYLTKQTTTLREINDSRVKIYEQLEVSIADLEATNKQLVEESKADKNRIKSLCTNINRLDARCEDLQRCLDEARHLVETSERKNKSVNQNSSIDVEKKISRSESSKNVKTSSFSPTVNGISNCTMPLQEESSCPNNSNLSSNIPNEIKSAKNGDEQNKSVDNHSPTTSSQEYNLRVPSLNHELELNSYSGTHGNRQWNLDSTNSQMFSSLPNSDEISHAKSEDSGYENGELSDKCYDTRKSDSDTFQNVTSSSSSSCSPQPKSSSSGSRVGSAFSDSPLESEEPISLGTVSSSFQNNVGSTQILSNNDEVRVNGDNTAPIQHSIALSLKKAAEAMMGKSVKSTVYSHQQMNGNITNLEMEESTNTVNEMERAISDLRAENLKLKLDLGGERNDEESASIDESLLSVDEEVQEVTAVRMGKLCRRCLGINDATPGILIDKAMDLMGETLVSELQDYFGSSSSNWVQHMKSSRVWLDAWLAGVCACAFLIALLRRAFDVSSSITYDLAEAWFNS